MVLDAWISPKGELHPITRDEYTHDKMIWEFSGLSTPEALVQGWVRVWNYREELNVEGTAQGIESVKDIIAINVSTRPSNVVLDVVDPMSLRKTSEEEQDDYDQDSDYEYDWIDVSVNYDEFLAESISSLARSARMMRPRRRSTPSEVRVRAHRRSR